MNSQTEGSAGGLMHGFTQRGMRVNRRFNFFESGLQIHSQAEFRNQFGGFRSDNMSPQYFAVRLPNDEFPFSANGKALAIGYFIISDQPGKILTVT